MKQFTLLFGLMLVFTFNSKAHDIETNDYKKVKIWLLDKNISDFRQLNLDIDHGTYKQNTWFITFMHSQDLQILKDNGYEYEIIIDDVQQEYQQRIQQSNQKSLKSNQCNNLSTYPEVENFSLGSMGGFYTYSEMLADLDSMTAKYPNLISQKAAISNFETHEGRPIYWLRISNNPELETNKPKALYTAVHHAREPISMSLVMYYMWFLLENYDTNDEIKYIVDNTELYFVPCINPDGYIYNQTTNPNGGGMHRKNRRNVGTSNKGVDLNRNYAFQWGGVGTSNNTNNDTYRGTAAFSEPETQAIKWLTENHDFSIALNYHSYSNLLLFPWGYTSSVQCEDHELFESFTEYMVRENGYDNIQSSGLYPAAGDSDDWMYGDTSTKAKIFALTPEVGSNSDNFWPVPNRILPLCKENLWQNISAAKILLDNVDVIDLSPDIFTTTSGFIKLNYQRLGLKNENFSISISAIDDCFSTIGNPILASGLEFGESATDSIQFVLSPENISNNTFRYEIIVTTANFTFRDTVTRYFGDTEIPFEDNPISMISWQLPTDWGKDVDAYTPPFSTSDSPDGNYSNNTTSNLFTTNIDLTDAAEAFLNFYAKWSIEAGYDFMQISASVEGSNSWTPLCGRYTKIGTSDQDEGNPLYDGSQNQWVYESINLKNFTGFNVQLRFQMVSDAFENADGFKFDDLKVTKVIGEVNNPLSNESIGQNFNYFSIYPNPSNGQNTFVNIDIKEPHEKIEIRIFDQIGRLIQATHTEKGKGVVELSQNDIPNGTYFVTLMVDGKSFATKKWVVLK